MQAPEGIGYILAVKEKMKTEVLPLMSEIMR
jgi:hypothetical protein